MEKKGSYEIDFMNDLPLFALVRKKAGEERDEDENAGRQTPSLLLEKLKSVCPDDLSPKQALETLYELKKLAETE